MSTYGLLHARWALAEAIVLAAAFGAAAEEPEWTFDRALAEWSPMVRPIAHVGVPGHEFQTAVLWDGSLVFGPLGFRELAVMQQEAAPLGDNLLHVSVGYGEPMRWVDRSGSGEPALTRSLEGGVLPIPHVGTRDGSLCWDQTVFAHLLGRELADGLRPLRDDLLVTHAVWSVRNAGDQPTTAHLWLHFGDVSEVALGYKAHVGAEPAPAIAHHFEAPLGRLSGGVRYVLPEPSSGGLVWHERVPPPDGATRPAERVIEWRVDLAPGGEAKLRLILPYAVVDQPTARRLAALDSDAELARTRDAWEGVVSGPGRIVTPDPFVNDYLESVVATMAEQVAYRWSTDTWMYKTSPNHYEGYWPCNAAKALPVFGSRGLGEVERLVLSGFVTNQTSDVGGLARTGMGHGEALAGEGYAEVPGFLGNFGEWTANPLLISHGLALWALASHYRMTRDEAWLGEGPGSPLQACLDGSDWVSTQRRRTMREVDGAKVPNWGLLPPASAHDWLAGSTIFNDAYCIYGMAEVVRMLSELGHPRAEAMAEELNAYRADLRARYVEARGRARPIPMPDGTELPFVPRMVEELDWRSIDWTYTGYGPIRAGAWGALDPHDELVDQSLAFLEAGMPSDGPWFGAHFANRDTADWNWAHVSDPGSPRHWIWRHYVEYETMWPVGGHLFLARDDLPRLFEWLTNNLAVVLHRDWRVGVESLDGVPSCAPGEGERWQLLRSMLVNEFGGWDGSEQALWLLQAVPREWLGPGKRIAAERIATRFGGPVSIEARVADDGNSVTAVATLDLTVAPSEVRIRLRSGDGRPLASATVNGQPATVLAGDVVILPTVLSGRLEVVGHF